MIMNITHGSLFTGLGGFDYAAAQLGWKNIFQCEINPFCQRVLKYHFPNTELYEDIKTTDFTKYRGKINVLSAGFPCQPFSSAGKRRGTEDNRYLWPETFRAFVQIRPDWFVPENVDGITSMVQPGSEIEMGNQKTLFEEDYTETILEELYILETICRDIEREGYSVQPVIIPACAVGAPHRRDRIWIIASNRADAGIESVQQRWENGVFESGTTSNPDSPNGNTAGLHSSKVSQLKASEILNIIANATGERLQGTMSRDAKLFTEPFSDFPTQSPVFRRNDGISDRLDTNAILNGRRPRNPYQACGAWRSRAIEALGNAIVPQVAYQIFNAINKVEQLKTNDL